MRSIFKLILFFVIVVVIFSFLILTLDNFNVEEKEIFYASDFNIQVLVSDNDFDSDGIDDYADILEGAKIEAENKPIYKSGYYSGGYPPESEGVCTDVIWRALKNAGYNLKDMVDKDIKENIKLYTDIDKPDSNIDFRRVKNLKVFFDNHYTILTNDPYDIDKWMPGDIVIFGTVHIAIISDKRNKEGLPYIIHNASQSNRDEDAIIYWYNTRGITGHYRM